MSQDRECEARSGEEWSVFGQRDCSDGRTDRKGEPNIVEEADRQRAERVEEAKREYTKLLVELQGAGAPSTMSPWLLTRYSLSDLGLRPIPQGDAHWKSPDIWLECSDILGNPAVGEENFVHVRIFNLGALDAAPVKVDFYWADPSLGIGPANANLIGTEWVEVKSLRSVDVRCSSPWIPTYVNDGHECLIVNCTNHILDPIIRPFQPRLDRHAAQRNVHVAQAPAGENVAFTIDLNNVFPIEAAFRISSRVERVARTEQELGAPWLHFLNAVLSHGDPETNTPAEMRRRFLPRTRENDTAKRIARIAARRSRGLGLQLTQRNDRSSASRHSGITVSIRMLGDLAESKVQQPAALLGNAMLALDKFADRLPSAGADLEVLHQGTLKPFQACRMEIEASIPSDAVEGEFIALHLMQRTETTIVGGYSLVVRVAG